MTVSGKHGSLKFRGGRLPYYRLAVVFALVGQRFTFHALHADAVSVVSPIMLVAGIAVITGR